MTRERESGVREGYLRQSSAEELLKKLRKERAAFEEWHKKFLKEDAVIKEFLRRLDESERKSDEEFLAGRAFFFQSNVRVREEYEYGGGYWRTRREDEYINPDDFWELCELQKDNFIKTGKFNDTDDELDSDGDDDDDIACDDPALLRLLESLLELNERWQNVQNGKKVGGDTKRYEEVG